MIESLSQKLSDYYKKNENQALEDYFTFLKFKSISSEPAYKKELLACADWVCNYLKNMHFKVEVWETSNHPVIFASLLDAGVDKPTLLIYNHYDVQPVDPVEKWLSPPFEPTIRDGQVYARGAQDNKGQCFYTLFALKAYLEVFKKLPINIKFCIEGEEECGSIGLTEILPKKKKELKADYLAVVDMGIKNSLSPAVTLGVRGIVTMDIIANGTNTDLHSGSHGGIAYNPIHALVEILSQIRGKDGRIEIPGFYDEVIPLTENQKELITFDFDEEEYKKTFGKAATGGEPCFTPHERSWTRPTVEINGINGGYSGDGFKTVIPALATAKISCRLVPNQQPQEIAKIVKNYLMSKAPLGVDIDVIVHDGFGAAVRADPTSKAVIAFADAYKVVFNKPCAFIYSGGSIPVIEKLAQCCEGEVVLMGLGLPDDQIHAPNEHFGIDRLEKGFNIIVKTIENLGN